jgi:hypothetical protein
MDKYRRAFGANLLFVIERSLDQDVVVYRAQRPKADGKLVDPFVEVFWTKQNDLAYRKRVSELALTHMFGARVEPQANRYKMVIKALPDQLITLHLKKSGKTVAKTVLNHQETRLDRVFVDVSVASGITGLTAYGVHNKQAVQHKIPPTAAMKGWSHGMFLQFFGGRGGSKRK